jgi:hypothetical protein
MFLLDFLMDCLIIAGDTSMSYCSVFAVLSDPFYHLRQFKARSTVFKALTFAFSHHAYGKGAELTP